MPSRPPVHVLIVPDKFKGTLSAGEVCRAIARGWQSVRPGDELDELPMSDGGDGFGAILARLTRAQTRQVRTVDAAHRSIRATWWWQRGGKLAILESARVIGLAMLPEKKFHPHQLDTFGLGRLLAEAARQGAQSGLIGIGGTATNDGGFGLARALGWKFLDRRGRNLDQWWQLCQLARIVPPKNPLALPLTVAVDVGNPLLGKRGCSQIFGPQKGLRAGDIVHAEKCLGRLSELVKQADGRDYARLPGAGAGGGLGFGLMAFAGAKLRAGFEVFAEAAALGQRLGRADLVITGEGAIDHQTYMGKGVGQIGQLCKKLHVPCVALAGRAQAPRSRTLFGIIRALTDLTTAETAKRQPLPYLEKLAAALAGEFARP